MEWAGYEVSALVDPSNLYKEPVTNVSRTTDPAGALGSYSGFSWAGDLA